MKRSEDIASQQELIVQAEERVRQATGAILPTVSGSVSYLTQPSPTQGSSFSPPSQTTVKLTATQPVFRGFREFAALKQQKILKEASDLNKESATLKLYQDVVSNFYQILTFEKDISNYRNEIDLNRKRLKELEGFKRLGKSKASDVLLLQSNIASLEAQVEITQGQLEAARDAYVFLTGLRRDARLIDNEVLPKPEKDLGSFLANIEKRPDIQSLVKSAEASEKGITIARGAHFPSVDLMGDYFFQRPGFLQDVNWDAQITLSMPIFQGGVIQSQVRSAVSVQTQSELALSKARRTAKKEIESFYHLYVNDYDQFEKQKNAVDWAVKTYNAEIHDYRLGLVTNLEVLQSMTAYQQSQRLLDDAILKTKSDYLQLLSASAKVPLPTEAKEGQ